MEQSKIIDTLETYQRLEEVDGGDEQYPVESRFAVRHTPPDEQDPILTVHA